MGRHTKEWIDNENELMKDQMGKFSLSDKNYKHPTIKVQFGEEYVPVPQIPILVASITRSGCVSLKEGLRLGVLDEAMKIADIDKNVYNSNELKKIDEAVSKIIYEKGPFYVFEKAYNMGFNVDIAMYYSEKEPDKPFAIEDDEPNYDEEIEL